MGVLKLRLFSTSTIHGSGYLDYCEEQFIELFKGSSNLLFLPFARPGGITHDQYAQIASDRFEKAGLRINGLHKYDDKLKAIEEADGFFTGGGNTFLLLKTLYELDILEGLKEKIKSGTPYMGTSAGSNIAGVSISTTNDMPIVYPPSFKALGLIDFNLNPHYLDPDLNSKHKGETRETRIKEFHHFNGEMVVGLREGSWLEINGEECLLGGSLKARVFRKNMDPVEIEPQSSVKSLLT